MEENKAINLMSRLEQMPLIERDNVELEEYKKINLDYLPQLSAGLFALSKTARTYTSTIDGSELYRAILPADATHLGKSQNGKGVKSLAFNSKNRLVGHADFEEVGTLTQTTTMPIDPAMVCVAIALMSIEQKLSEIKEVSDSILELIELQDRTQLKANFITLKNIARDFKNTINDLDLRKNKHVQVLNIQTTAQEKVTLFHDKIALTLKKSHGFIHTKADIDKRAKIIKEDLSDYQLALYVYAYSVYMDMLLLNNFNQNRLSDVIDELFGLSNEYKKIFATAFAQIADDSSDSVERTLIKGAASISKKTGELIAKIPLISKSNIDESLVETGEKLASSSDEQFVDYLEQMMKLKNSGIMLFIDNLREIKETFTEPIDVVVDKEFLYYKPATELKTVTI